MRIGVFDSGLGGLTVAREIKKLYPNHSIIYVGDTARVPWGVRSPKVIEKFALQLQQFLIKQNVDMVVVACHTASCVAIPALQENTKLKVTGVIEPSARAVSEISSGRVGILGTPTTVRSGAWELAIKNLKPEFEVYSNAASLLVPIIEEDLDKHEVAKLMVKEYAQPLLHQNVDTIVLACTHYPLLQEVFRNTIPTSVQLVNPGLETAKSLNLDTSTGEAKDEFYFTDLSDRVRSRLESFYGRPIDGNVKEVPLEELE